jgi:hypothetical protein
MHGNLVWNSVDLQDSAVLIIGAPQRVMGVQVTNTSADEIYVHFYDVTDEDDVDVGDTATKMTIAVPAGEPLSFEHTGGIIFNSGIAVACTNNGTGSSSSDSAPSGGACVISVLYQP